MSRSRRGCRKATVPLGMLIYTRDGHVSVQLMYPKADMALSNQYVQAGYEASFGSYDVDEARQVSLRKMPESRNGSESSGLRGEAEQLAHELRLSDYVIFCYPSRSAFPHHLHRLDSA